MQNSEEVLGDFAKAKSKFLTLEDGEEVRAMYLGARKVESRFFDGEDHAIQYYLDIEDCQKILTSASKDFAKQMQKIPTGSEVFIRREGIGVETRLFVTTMDEKIELAVAEAED